MPDPFRSPERLTEAFEQGLVRLLDDGGLGAFILVLANASFEPALFERLQDPLRRRFRALESECLEALHTGRSLPYPDDDLMVFLKLMALGFDALEASRFRDAGPWELHLNLLRAMRPRRVSGQTPGGIRRPFDPEGFHFCRSFLRPEILWSGSLAGRDAQLFYNKFPFVSRHGLLVVEPERRRPQLMEREDHLHVWEVAGTLGERLPGAGIGYNSYGAQASVNHLHFQLFVRERPLPAAGEQWRHNGGARAYPAVCERLDSPRQAWEYIEGLHQSETAYNLVYLPGCVYCMPRAMQGAVAAPDWTAGIAWAELAGLFTVFSREVFDRLDAAELEAELARVSVPPPF